MLKIVCSLNLGFCTELFNIILKSGIYPSPWRENYIMPIFKSGCFRDPSTYRGIALSSCLGKANSRIRYNRLEKYLDKNSIICKEQIGFKKGAELRTIF